MLVKTKHSKWLIIIALVQLVLRVDLTESKRCTFNGNPTNRWVRKEHNIVMICWTNAIIGEKDDTSFVEFCPSPARYHLFISSDIWKESHSTQQGILFQAGKTCTVISATNACVKRRLGKDLDYGTYEIKITACKTTKQLPLQTFAGLITLTQYLTVHSLILKENQWPILEKNNFLWQRNDFLIVFSTFPIMDRVPRPDVTEFFLNFNFICFTQRLDLDN